MNPPEQNDDFSWLVYADWLDDHDIPGADEIRTDVAGNKKNHWSFEDRSVSGGVGVVVGGGVGFVGVGGGGVGGVGGGVGGVVGGVGGGVVGSGVGG